MTRKPSERFSDRVADYLQYRPRYPEALIPLLAERCGLAPDHAIADVGSGTGFLAELFLRHGNTVHAVEPNEPMRAAAEQCYGHFPNFVSVDGAAEASGLPERSVDLVTAGQAFHWFDAAAARTEFARMLRPGGWTVLVWNERRVEERGFPVDYEALLHRHGTDYAAVDHRNVDGNKLRAFFAGGHVELAVLENAQMLDRDGLAGRLRSCSYVPAPGEPGFAPMMDALNALFDQYQNGGHVTIVYDTKVYMGQFAE